MVRFSLTFLCMFSNNVSVSEVESSFASMDVDVYSRNGPGIAGLLFMFCCCSSCCWVQNSSECAPELGSRCGWSSEGGGWGRVGVGLAVFVVFPSCLSAVPDVKLGKLGCGPPAVPPVVVEDSDMSAGLCAAGSTGFSFASH